MLSQTRSLSDYLFAYGTLQPAHAPDAIAHLVAKLRPLGEGSIPGVLYDFGEFPGAIIDALSPHRIFGTVFQLTGDKGVLPEIDSYEGFDPHEPERSLFVRELCPVQLSSADTVRCWVYVYNQSTARARVVPSGRYAPRSR